MATAADRLIDLLLDWDVDTVFGLPGDGINGIMEALRKRQDRLRFVHVRHEESAALMACAWAKVTNRLGVCLATSGPGGLHLINGLYDAKLDGQPVLAITGLPFHDLLGTRTQQDVPLDRVFTDVAVFNERVMGAAHLDNLVHLACRTALARRGVAHLAFPIDLQSAEIEGDRRSLRNVPGHTTDAPASGVRLPDGDGLERAAEILRAGEKLVVLVGRGALDAGEEVIALAERLAAPVAYALLGKGVIPDRHPHCLGSVGFLGTDAAAAALESCDTLLLVGTSMPYLEYYPKPGQADSPRAVQIDADATRIGLRYPVELGLVGDSRLTLQALLPLLPERQGDPAARSFLTDCQRQMIEWRARLAGEASVTARPIRPQRIAQAVGERLRDDAIVCGDSGTSTVWWARHVPAHAGQRHLVSGTLATMGCALPYAIAAQLAYPDRQCVALTGDGGLQMVLAELITCAKYKLPIKVVVFNNQSLAYIRWEQLLMQGNPEFGVDIAPTDFAAIARGCGVEGMRIEDPATVDSDLDRALAYPGPMVIDVLVDPLEPPTPPRLAPELARKFAEALAKGQPDRDRIAESSLGRKVRELV